MTAFQKSLADVTQLFESLVRQEPILQTASAWCVEALQSGAKLLLCGNGGSASEAQHLAGELMGRYKQERHAFAAIALASDVAVLTCIGNDYSFDEIFARQVRALGRRGDVLIVFTTSGNSPNVLAALETARDMRLRSIAFLGQGGGRAKTLADCPLLVEHADTARVQEAHQFLMHCFMDQIEAGIFATPQRSSGDPPSLKKSDY